MVNQSDNFILGSELPREAVVDGIERQILGYNGQIMMVRVWFDKGAVGEVHSHYHSQVSYVESGVFAVNVGGEIKHLKAGDSFFIPPNVDHGAVCIEPGVLLDVFSPVRDDFLNGEGYANEG
jgi:quercetin dioxygenase-like cupin family protein